MIEYEKLSELKMKDRYIKDVDGMMEWWRPKAIKRYEKLYEENKLDDSVLFYDELIGISWEEAKNKFLPQVGR